MARTAGVSFTHVTAGDTLFDAVSNAMNCFAARFRGEGKLRERPGEVARDRRRVLLLYLDTLAAVPSPLGI